jgi:hypothetical protein
MYADSTVQYVRQRALKHLLAKQRYKSRIALWQAVDYHGPQQ